MTVDDSGAPFSDLVGLLNEPNMCSGGAATLHDILRAAPWLTRPGLQWLEVGSNTGFSSLELASLLDATVVGIDINAESIAHARRKADELGLTNVSFIEGDGTKLPFDDGHFDVVFCSNVTSFILDRRAAASEYFRVVRPLGFVIAVPIYYVDEPPPAIRDGVERAIGAPLGATDLASWKALYTEVGGVLVHEIAYRYEPQEPARIADYAASVAAQPENDWLDDRTREAARHRLEAMYRLFDENLRYARFSSLIFRRGAPTTWPVLHRTAPAGAS